MECCLVASKICFDSSVDLVVCKYLTPFPMLVLKLVSDLRPIDIFRSVFRCAE